jgi:hypothetical protein
VCFLVPLGNMERINASDNKQNEQKSLNIMCVNKYVSKYEQTNRRERRNLGHNNEVV